MQFQNIPFRRWRCLKSGGKTRFTLVISKQYRSVWRVVGKAMREGKNVDYEHVIVNKEPKANQPYDVINARIF